MNKKFVSLDKCKHVLICGLPLSSTNKKFRVHDNTTFTNEQEKAGFFNFYCKRELTDDVHTKTLDLVLSPWEDVSRFYQFIPYSPFSTAGVRTEI